MIKSWAPFKARLIELATAPEGYSNSQIAAILSEEFDEEFTRHAVRHQLETVEIDRLEDLPKPVPTPYFDKYKEQIGKYDRVVPGGLADKGRRSILSISDMHFPFCKDDALQLAIDRNRTADVCIVSEPSDMYSLSSFRKFYNVPVETEIEDILRFFEYVSSIFPVTLVLDSNHNRRVSRDVYKVVDPALYFMFETNLLKALAAPFPNIYYVDNWFYQVNDAVFCHADKASSVDNKVLVQLLDHFRNWQVRNQLQPFNVIVQHHTHYLGVVYRDGIKLIEGGCLCRNLEYTSGDRAQAKPHLLGYAVVKQNDGISDLNLSREFFIPYMRT